MMAPLFNCYTHSKSLWNAARRPQCRKEHAKCPAGWKQTSCHQLKSFSDKFCPPKTSWSPLTTSSRQRLVFLRGSVWCRICWFTQTTRRSGTSENSSAPQWKHNEPTSPTRWWGTIINIWFKLVFYKLHYQFVVLAVTQEQEG